MSGWTCIPLAELVSRDDKINYGVVQPGPAVSDGVPLVRVGDLLGDGVQLDTLKRIAPDVEKAYLRSRLRGDEVLVACVGSIGEVSLATPALAGANIARAVARIRCGEYLDRRFLAHFLRTDRAQQYFRRHTRAVAQPTLNIKQIEQLPVPLPPLPEQKRIAAILDKADAIRRKRQDAIRLTEELLRAAFLEMFGDPVTNPKGWPVRRLGEVISDVENGWSPVCEARPAEGDEWAVLKLGCVTYGRYNPRENKAMTPDATPRPELEVQAGDLLFSRKNTLELVGATAFVFGTPYRLTLPDTIFRLRLNTAADGVYLWQLLSHPGIREVLRKQASGTAGSMPNISKARLKSVELPVPPMEEQLAFRRFVEKVEATRARDQQTADVSADLGGSLTARAFSGRL